MWSGVFLLDFPAAFWPAIARTGAEIAGDRIQGYEDVSP